MQKPPTGGLSCCQLAEMGRPGRWDDRIVGTLDDSIGQIQVGFLDGTGRVFQLKQAQMAGTGEYFGNTLDQPKPKGKINSYSAGGCNRPRSQCKLSPDTDEFLDAEAPTVRAAPNDW